MAVKNERLTGTNSYVELELKDKLSSIGTVFVSDVLTCIHPIGPPYDDFIRDELEDVPEKAEKLLVILETNGGSIETAERIAEVLPQAGFFPRSKLRNVCWYGSCYVWRRHLHGLLFHLGSY